MKKSIPAIAAVALATLLAGCTVDAATVEKELEVAMTSIEGVDGALTGVGYDGPKRAAIVKLYVPEATPTTVDDIVDEALRQAWRIMPSEPGGLTVEVVAGQRPDDAALSDRDGIDLGDLGSRLGFSDARAGRLLVVPAHDLESRYGPWVAP